MQGFWEAKWAAHPHLTFLQVPPGRSSRFLFVPFGAVLKTPATQAKLPAVYNLGAGHHLSIFMTILINELSRLR